MKEIIKLILNIPKMINSSYGLESIMGIILLGIVFPIIMLIGLGVFKLIQLIFN